jgi:hypothetical protein
VNAEETLAAMRAEVEKIKTEIRETDPTADLPPEITKFEAALTAVERKHGLA